jgi:hypothetical protein
MIPEWYGNLAQAALPATGRNLPLPTAILAQKDEPAGDPPQRVLGPSKARQSLLLKIYIMPNRKDDEPNHHTPRQTDAKPKIEAVLSALQQSWNRHDVAAFAAQFTENADFVNVVGMHVRGRPAIEAQHVAISQDRVSQ